MHAVLFRILESEPEPVQRWFPDGPDPVAALAAKALTKDPGRRFANGSEMAARCARCARSWPGRARRPQGRWPRSCSREGERRSRSLTPSPRPPAATSPSRPSSIRTPRPRGPGGRRGREPTLSGKAPTRPGVRGAPTDAAAASPGAARLGDAGWRRGRGRRGRGAAWHGGCCGPSGRDVADPTAASGADGHERARAAAPRGRARPRPGEPAGSRVPGRPSSTPSGPSGCRPTTPRRSGSARPPARPWTPPRRRPPRPGRRSSRATPPTAGRRLEELLEIQPKHPAVAELTTELNASFRPQAEQARSAMRQPGPGATPGARGRPPTR